MASMSLLLFSSSFLTVNIPLAHVTVAVPPVT